MNFGMLYHLDMNEVVAILGARLIWIDARSIFMREGNQVS